MWPFWTFEPLIILDICTEIIPKTTWKTIPTVREWTIPTFKNSSTKPRGGPILWPQKPNIEALSWKPLPEPYYCRTASGDLDEAVGIFPRGLNTWSFLKALSVKGWWFPFWKRYKFGENIQNMLKKFIVWNEASGRWENNFLEDAWHFDDVSKSYIQRTPMFNLPVQQDCHVHCSSGDFPSVCLKKRYNLYTTRWFRKFQILFVFIPMREWFPFWLIFFR